MITGDCDYKEFKMSQHKDAVKIFCSFIEKTKPARILEIGTYTGGFIVSIGDIVKKLGLDTTIITYDITERNPYNTIRNLGIDVRVENIFTPSYTELTSETKEKLISFIQNPGVTLILCDGGNKINEFNIFANYIKSGDFIMAHDYSESLEYFRDHINEKIWNWCEITGSHIDSACKLNNLKDYMKEEFQSVVWACKQKE